MTIVYEDTNVTIAHRAPVTGSDLTARGRLWQDLSSKEGYYTAHIGGVWIKQGDITYDNELDKLQQLVDDLTLRVEELEQINKDTISD